MWKALDEEHGPVAFPAESVELIEIVAPSQVIVFVKTNIAGDVYLRYLREAPNHDQWRYSGSFWSENRRYPLHHRIIQFGTKPFFLVTAPGGYGSGLGMDGEAWMDLTVPHFEPVFDYSPQGYRTGMLGYPSREWSSRVLSIVATPIETIRVEYVTSLKCGLSDGELPISKRTDTLTYTRSGGQEFKLNAARSTLSATDVSKLFEDPDSAAAEDILRWFFEPLKRVASGSDSPTRQWLALYLKKCKPTAERRELEALLAK
jgi:hypothetical protein